MSISFMFVNFYYNGNFNAKMIINVLLKKKLRMDHQPWKRILKRIVSERAPTCER